MAHFEPERRIELQQVRNRLEEIKSFVYTDARGAERVEYCVTGTGRGP